MIGLTVVSSHSVRKIPAYEWVAIQITCRRVGVFVCWKADVLMCFCVQQLVFIGFSAPFNSHCNISRNKQNSTHSEVLKSDEMWCETYRRIHDMTKLNWRVRQLDWRNRKVLYVFWTNRKFLQNRGRNCAFGKNRGIDNTFCDFRKSNYTITRVPGIFNTTVIDVSMRVVTVGGIVVMVCLFV